MEPPFNKPPDFIEKPNQIGHTLLVFLIGIISSLLFIIQNRLQEVKEQSTQAQLQMLRAQINPHFLFNTLNSIYALALKKDDRTPQAIINLSEFMRYAVTDQHETHIALAAEIKYLESYIELQKARLGNTVNVRFTISGMASNQRIVPLIFITFLENAFKHGISGNEKSEITIQLDIAPSFVTLVVENPIYKSNSEGSGIGLRNSLKRLEMMYPDKHQLEMTETNGKYRVFLKLEL
jgi:LytS/YehU family sensor histidine kinase